LRLAKATGGRTLYGRNDVDVEIGTAIQDGSSFYTLTYHPASFSADPRKSRDIKVTLSRPDLSVITRAVPPTGRLLMDVNLQYKLAHNPKAARARFTVRVDASGCIGTADGLLGQNAAPAPQLAQLRPTPTAN
jgi:hypothetical protein